MHRTLKENTTKPPAASLGAQQSRFDSFRYVFNNERPHEGLNNQVPASLYTPAQYDGRGRLHPSERELRQPKEPCARKWRSVVGPDPWRHPVFSHSCFADSPNLAEVHGRDDLATNHIAACASVMVQSPTSSEFVNECIGRLSPDEIQAYLSDSTLVSTRRLPYRDRLFAIA
jgi:hypothetical protein